MLAARLHAAALSETPLRLEEIEVPQPGPGEVLLKVEACGVCRTDLHIVSGELPLLRQPLTPGHQIVGRMAAVGAGVTSLPIGLRVGVSWLGGVDQSCFYCRNDRENLCDNPTFTGYSVDGGYAGFVVAKSDFLVPLPPSESPVELAPLLCAGIIGFRSLRVANVQPGMRVGLFGFGASAHLAIEVLKHWNCEVYVSTRGESHRRLAQECGAAWVGNATARPPVALDAAVTFAPSGDVVVAALASLRKGGVVAINAIHLDRIPQFDYDSLLWGERQLRSVANMTRQDARDFVSLAVKIGIKPRTTVFRLKQANEALAAVAGDRVDGAVVLVP